MQRAYGGPWGVRENGEDVFELTAFLHRKLGDTVHVINHHNVIWTLVTLHT